MLNLLSAARTYGWHCVWGDCMTSFRPTEIGQLAIEAKLNLVLGPEAYDRVFPGFEVLEVVDGELRAWAPSEHQAAVIDVRYSGMVAWIAQTVFNSPIRRVSVLLRGLKHDGCEQPAFGASSRFHGNARRLRADQR
jgi:hypothetical protein